MYLNLFHGWAHFQKSPPRIFLGRGSGGAPYLRHWPSRQRLCDDVTLTGIEPLNNKLGNHQGNQMDLGDEAWMDGKLVLARPGIHMPEWWMWLLRYLLNRRLTFSHPRKFQTFHGISSLSHHFSPSTLPPYFWRSRKPKRSNFLCSPNTTTTTTTCNKRETENKSNLIRLYLVKLFGK